MFRRLLKVTDFTSTFRYRHWHVVIRVNIRVESGMSRDTLLVETSIGDVDFFWYHRHISINITTITMYSIFFMCALLCQLLFVSENA